MNAVYLPPSDVAASGYPERFGRALSRSLRLPVSLRTAKSLPQSSEPSRLRGAGAAPGLRGAAAVSAALRSLLATQVLPLLAVLDRADEVRACSAVTGSDKL